MVESFRKRLVGGDLLLGTIVSLPSSEVAELLAHLGFDWLFIDMEHGALDILTAQKMLQAASPFIPCAVRPPSSDEVWIKKCLDIGPSGIVVPLIKSKEEAADVIQRAKYPPLGSRSVGIGRAHTYGVQFQEYIATANEDVAVILQIEHIDAVENIDEIVKISGIDGFFVGPYDLSASMGKIGKVEDDDVQEAIARVRDSAAAANIPIGIFTATGTGAKPYIEQGYRLMASGLDSMLLAGAAKELLSSMQPD